MQVIKRNGEIEDVSFDKVLNRIKNIIVKNNLSIEPVKIAQQVCSRIYDKVKTSELDEFTADLCISMSTEHPDYGTLASNIMISNNHKNTSPSFSETMGYLYHNYNSENKHNPLISEKMYSTIQKHKNKLNDEIKYERDYLIDYFGFKTLERSYLTKINKTTIERPQHMFMRVSVGIHDSNIHDVLETYNMMSQKYFIHATPTLFNAGTDRPQLSSCFLLGTEDSIIGMYKNISDCAIISKWSGGIGVHVSNIRANRSYIAGTNGQSSGLIPLLRVYNETAKHVNQGGKRNGSIAIYLEPWHADIEDFLEIRKNHGDENMRARDLFSALWIPDIFMRRVEEDGVWSLMCPNESPGLPDVYGDEFDKLYTSYEASGKFRKQVPARKIWFDILKSQIETGTPYIAYKDAVNKKSNQQNIGVIKSSNLCIEINEVSNSENHAVCNLASVAVNMFYDTESKTYDFVKLGNAISIMTKNLNKIIDKNFYPTPETKKSNLECRPIGIGIQGLADLFFKMRINFDSKEAIEINEKIFSCMYYYSMKTSMELSKKNKPYKYFEGSPLSRGLFQFDMWGVKPDSSYNWNELRENVMKHGVRNSLLIALMPTASTSQILGNYECFEAITSNMYMRRVLAGEFVVLNKYLLNDLIRLKLWNHNMKNEIIRNNGSIQLIKSIPEDIRMLYRTVFEISQKAVIDLAASRSPYVCQAQSMNIFIANPDYSNLTSCHFYGWKKGLKTGMYYLRSKPKVQAQQFTVEKEEKKEEMVKGSAEYEAAKLECSLTNKEACMMCSG